MAAESWVFLLAFPLATSLWRAFGLSWRLSVAVTGIIYCAVAVFAAALAFFL